MMKAQVYIAKSDEHGKRQWAYYEVPCAPSDRVSQALQYIYENLDADIAYRQCFCKRGSCGLCMMKVNGKCVKTCRTPVSSVMRIEPLPLPVVRDLVVSFPERGGKERSQEDQMVCSHG